MLAKKKDKKATATEKTFSLLILLKNIIENHFIQGRSKEA